jgi:hypothetical protein
MQKARKAVRVAKPQVLLIAVFLVACSTVVGQSGQHLTQSTRMGKSGMFRIEGEVNRDAGIVVPGAEVEFLRLGHTFRTMHANSKGRYATELPFGSYTMTVRGSGPYGPVVYRRPDFAVHDPERVVLNVTLRAPSETCDVGVTIRVPGPVTTEPTTEDAKNACGGNDRFPVPSDDGEPFEVGIDYPTRRPTDSGFVYGGDRPDSQGQVSVAYNLFSSWADRVVYNTKNRTIEAQGNVVTSDGSGKKQHADSIRFKMENGQAIETR